MFGIGEVMVSAIGAMEYERAMEEAEKAKAAEAFKDDPEGYSEWLRVREKVKAEERQYAIDERRHRELVEATRSRGASAGLGGLIGFIIGSSMN